MNKSTDILAQIQQIRLEQTKPKKPIMLKNVRINESQKSELYVTLKDKTHHITVKKTGTRNTFAFAFAIGFHTILAILIGVFCIADPIVLVDNISLMELLTIEDPKPHPHHPHPHHPHPPGGYDPKPPYPQALHIQREPVPTPTDLPQPQDTFNLANLDVSNVGISENSTRNGSKSFEVRESVSPPTQLAILKLTPIFIIEKSALTKTSFGKLTQAVSNKGISSTDSLDLVKTETIPLQTKPIVKPAYPKMAKLLKKEGKVILRATIDIDGIPKEITVLTNLGYGLEEAAIEALKNSRYIPAKKNGNAIARLVEIQFEFKIQE